MFLDRKVLDMNGNRIVTYSADNTTYTITEFGGRDSTKMFAKLVKYGSGAFGGVLRGIFTETGDEEEDEKGLDMISVIIAGCLQDAFVDLDDERFLKFICDEILANVCKGNTPIDYDIEFKGNLLKAFDLIALVIDYNYRHVFQHLDIRAYLSKLKLEE